MSHTLQGQAGLCSQLDESTAGDGRHAELRRAAMKLLGEAHKPAKDESHIHAVPARINVNSSLDRKLRQREGCTAATHGMHSICWAAGKNTGADMASHLLLHPLRHSEVVLAGDIALALEDGRYEALRKQDLLSPC